MEFRSSANFLSLCRLLTSRSKQIGKVALSWKPRSQGHFQSQHPVLRLSLHPHCIMFSRFFNKKSDSSPDEDPIPSAAPAASLPNDTDFEHVRILPGTIYNHPDPISSLSDCTGSRTFDSWAVPSIQSIRNSDTTKYRQRTSSEPHWSPIQALCHCTVQEQRLSRCTTVSGQGDPLQDEEQPGQAIPIGL